MSDHANSAATVIVDDGPPPGTLPRRIVGVQFRRAAAMIYDFDAADLALVHDSRVVVETERGEAVGWTVGEPEDRAPHSDGALRRILRLADEDDKARQVKLRQQEREALRFCAQRARELQLPMKVIAVEWAHSGEKGAFYFSSEDRIDFRALVRELAQRFRVRVEMRQVGPRDEAKIIGAMGPCGRETCCSSWMRAFTPVSIKMAKDQGLSINPAKVTGVCGRLLCCLAYEQDTYRDLRRKLPRIGKQVMTPRGAGRVIDILVLRERVRVYLENGEAPLEFAASEVRALGAGPVVEEPETEADSAEAALDDLPAEPVVPPAPPPRPAPEVRAPQSRPERHVRSERPPGDQPPQAARGERPPHGDRANRPSPGDRPNRPQHGARSDAPAPPPTPGPDEAPKPPQGGRPNHPPQGERPNRPPQGERQNRPPQGERQNRPPQGERPNHPPQAERPNRPPQDKRPNRPPQGERPNRPPQGERQNRPPQGERPNRPPQGPRPDHRPDQPPQTTNAPGTPASSPAGEGDRPPQPAREHRRPPRPERPRHAGAPGPAGSQGHAQRGGAQQQPPRPPPSAQSSAVPSETAGAGEGGAPSEAGASGDPARPHRHRNRHRRGRGGPTGGPSGGEPSGGGGGEGPAGP